MNELFAKCVLYAYPNTEALCDQIDELIEKRRLPLLTIIRRRFRNAKKSWNLPSIKICFEI